MLFIRMLRMIYIYITTLLKIGFQKINNYLTVNTQPHVCRDGESSKWSDSESVPEPNLGSMVRVDSSRFGDRWLTFLRIGLGVHGGSSVCTQYMVFGRRNV